MVYIPINTVYITEIKAPKLGCGERKSELNKRKMYEKLF